MVNRYQRCTRQVFASNKKQLVSGRKQVVTMLEGVK
jgi:hypothetical protein